MWTSSWLNFEPSVTKSFAFPKRIELEDWTLQGDGEETPGVVYTDDEALAIAQKLDEVGVHRIVTGLLEPQHPEDARVVKKIAHLGLRAKIETIAGLSKPELERAISYDVWGVDLTIAGADFWLRRSEQEKRRAEAIEIAQTATSYCKAHGLKVTLNIRDAGRADPKFVRRAVKSVSDLADAIRVSDPYGMVNPIAFGKMIRMIKSWTKLPIAIHCHNDLGLATANALAGVASGASIPNTAVNGIGERCGLSSLEEVAVALRILYNIDTGIKLEKLAGLSHLVDEASGHLMTSQKAIVGERAFGWESDRSAPTGNLARVPFAPQLVGNDYRFFPGKKIGPKGIQRVASEQGFELTDHSAGLLVTKIRKLSNLKKQPSYEELRQLFESNGGT